MDGDRDARAVARQARQVQRVAQLRAARRRWSPTGRRRRAAPRSAAAPGSAAGRRCAGRPARRPGRRDRDGPSGSGGACPAARGSPAAAPGRRRRRPGRRAARGGWRLLAEHAGRDDPLARRRLPGIEAGAAAAHLPTPAPRRCAPAARGRRWTGSAPAVGGARTRSAAVAPGAPSPPPVAAGAARPAAVAGQLGMQRDDGLRRRPGVVRRALERGGRRGRRRRAAAPRPGRRAAPRPAPRAGSTTPERDTRGASRSAAVMRAAVAGSWTRAHHSMRPSSSAPSSASAAGRARASPPRRPPRARRPRR